MAFEIVIPRLGWSMEEGVFVDWLKKPGDYVKRGDPLFELEGEKAIQEVEAVDDGVLHLHAESPPPGTNLPVGSVLGYLLAEGEEFSSQPSTTQTPPRAETHKSDATPAAGPAARRKAGQLKISLDHVQGTGPGGRIQIEDIEQYVESNSVSQQTSVPAEKTIATPRAKRIARELGVDWSSLNGTGAQGRIREADVRRAASSIQSTPVANGRRLPVSRRRRVIAERMAASHAQTVPVTLTSQADATNLVNLREQLKQLPSIESLPSYQDMIVKLAAELLPRHPLLASRWDQDDLVIPGDDEWHIGIAVDTPEGLLVPVIQNPRTSSLMEVAKESRKLVERARTGQLPAAALHGGVFTITNLGAFGIDFFTPVINLPEAAILGLGAIRAEPGVTNDGNIVVRQRLSLSLTFDHRRLDGAPAARFLQELVVAISNPSAWLLAHT